MVRQGAIRARTPFRRFPRCSARSLGKLTAPALVQPAVDLSERVGRLGLVPVGDPVDRLRGIALHHLSVAREVSGRENDARGPGELDVVAVGVAANDRVDAPGRAVGHAAAHQLLGMRVEVELDALLLAELAQREDERRLAVGDDGEVVVVPAVRLLRAEEGIGAHIVRPDVALLDCDADPLHLGGAVDEPVDGLLGVVVPLVPLRDVDVERRLRHLLQQEPLVDARHAVLVHDRGVDDGVGAAAGHDVGALCEHHDLEPALRRREGAAQAGGSGADDDDVGGDRLGDVGVVDRARRRHERREGAARRGIRRRGGRLLREGRTGPRRENGRACRRRGSARDKRPAVHPCACVSHACLLAVEFPFARRTGILPCGGRAAPRRDGRSEGHAIGERPWAEHIEPASDLPDAPT